MSFCPFILSSISWQFLFYLNFNNILRFLFCCMQWHVCNKYSSLSLTVQFHYFHIWVFPEEESASMSLLGWPTGWLAWIMNILKEQNWRMYYQGQFYVLMFFFSIFQNVLAILIYYYYPFYISPVTCISYHGCEHTSKVMQLVKNVY